MNKQDLKELGLTEHEIDIYLALLQHGSLSAYDLAEKLGFYRQLTYDLLHRLMERDMFILCNKVKLVCILPLIRNSS